MLKINLVKDCWGSYSYVGLKDNRQYTEIFDTIEELKEQYPEYEGIKAVLKNRHGWNLIIQDQENLLYSDTIEGLKNYKDTIFFNDLNGSYWMTDFSINGTWFEVKKIDTVEKNIELIAFN